MRLWQSQIRTTGFNEMRSRCCALRSKMEPLHLRPAYRVFDAARPWDVGQALVSPGAFYGPGKYSNGGLPIDEPPYGSGYTPWKQFRLACNLISVNDGRRTAISKRKINCASHTLAHICQRALHRRRLARPSTYNRPGRAIASLIREAFRRFAPQTKRPDNIMPVCSHIHGGCRTNNQILHCRYG